MFKFFLIVKFTTLIVLNVQQIQAKLSENDLKYVSQLDNDLDFQETLNNIMRPRVVGTQSYKAVQKYIIDELEVNGMQVELDSFEEQTPIFGKLEFTNIIGRLNPQADKFLTLSCHYDSKYFKNFEFLAATDSAVPCAQMLSVIKTSMPALRKLTNGSNLGLMLIFFDGEEAFLNWNSRDSLYGSRHLAQKWAQQPYKNAREIDRINVLVLLDLIGSSNQKFYCTFPKTCKLNKRLSDIETSLKNSRALVSDSQSGKIFQNRFSLAQVDDDHRPFLERNVPILHLIPSRFPSVWHKESDNEENLNKRAITNFNKVLRSFVVDYLSECTRNLESNYCNYD